MIERTRDIDIWAYPDKLDFREACALPDKVNAESEFDDWILPNILQLQLLYMSDLIISAEWFWSSSVYKYNAYDAWSVFFFSGFVSYSYRSSRLAVRLVRSSQLERIGAMAVEKAMVRI
jgi:hypothetical protein